MARHHRRCRRARPRRHGRSIPLVVSIFAKAGLVVVKYRHGRNIGSSSLIADAANDAIDIVSGLVALGALSLTLWRPVEFAHADHYGAFAVGIIVIVTALRVMQQSSMHLMDTMPEDAAMAEVRRRRPRSRRSEGSREVLCPQDRPAVPRGPAPRSRPAHHCPELTRDRAAGPREDPR